MVSGVDAFQRCVCLLRRAVLLVCMLTASLAPSFMYPGAPQTECAQNAKLAYEAHLPKEIHQVCLTQSWINEHQSENVREARNSDGAHNLRIEVTLSQKGEEYVLIDYYAEKAIDNFRGVQLGYRKQSLIAYAVFDEQGRDYVALGPFSEEDETNTARFLLDRIFPIFK